MARDLSNFKPFVNGLPVTAINISLVERNNFQMKGEMLYFEKRPMIGFNFQACMGTFIEPSIQSTEVTGGDGIKNHGVVVGGFQ
jgi:hypothetical protein